MRNTDFFNIKGFPPHKRSKFLKYINALNSCTFKIINTFTDSRSYIFVILKKLHLCAIKYGWKVSVPSFGFGYHHLKESSILSE